MGDPLKIAICEDTVADTEKLLAFLSTGPIETQCTVFTSGEALLETYKPEMYDLLLTDIYMGGMTGVDLVAKIREMADDIPVAFITTSSDHALEGYRLSALKYIEKPFRPKDIQDILKLALLEKNSAPALSVRKNGLEERIRYSQILYIEQQVHHLDIHTLNSSSVQIYEKLSTLLPDLEAHNFFQPHKSFAVNLSFVRFIDSELKVFVMQDGKNVPIRRESMGKARKVLKEYLFSKTRGGTP